MDKSTSSDIVKIKKVSQERIDGFNLTKYLLNLLMEEPFYSRIIRSLNKVESDVIPTAGVLCQDGELTLWWNRKFLASLEPKKVKGLLKHECLHLVFNHTTERRREPHMIWNYATDLAINSIIPMDELPEGGLIPGYPLPKLTDEDKQEMSDKKISNYQHISNLIKSLPQNKTSEFYFEKLSNDKKLMEACEEEGGTIGLGFDDHEGWGNLDESEKELVKQKINEILKDSINKAAADGWGSISHQMQKEFFKMISRAIKWEDILKRFCGYTRKDERSSSTKRLNRKYPCIHPGIKKVYKPTIAVYIDESGSMPDEILNKFYDELNMLSKKTDFYVYKFDANVNDKDGFLWKKNKRVKLNRSLCGGTSFAAVTNHALKNNKKFDGYIIFTDGCAPKPKVSHRLKRCWLIIPGYKLPFSHDKNDILINMKN